MIRVGLLGIAAVLRRAGASNSRVLLVDTDSQGHATLITTGQKDYGVASLQSRDKKPFVFSNRYFSISDSWDGRPVVENVSNLAGKISD